MNSDLKGSKTPSPKILVVEDHEHVRTTLKDFLAANFPDADLLEATNGEEAVAIANVESPDVVLMDIGLPVLNGIDATRRIKAEMPDLKVVMLTIHENPEYLDDAKDAGANGYVLKRKMASDLIPIISRMIAKAL